MTQSVPVEIGTAGDVPVPACVEVTLYVYCLRTPAAEAVAARAAVRMVVRIFDLNSQDWRLEEVDFCSECRRLSAFAKNVEVGERKAY